MKFPCRASHFGNILFDPQPFEHAPNHSMEPMGRKNDCIFLFDPPPGGESSLERTHCVAPQRAGGAQLVLGSHLRPGARPLAGGLRGLRAGWGLGSSE